MFADPPAADPGARDVIHAIVGFCADVHQHNPHIVSHDGDCGERLFCDRLEHRAGDFPRVELLASGALVFHCEALTIHPGDPAYDERLMGVG